MACAALRALAALTRATAGAPAEDPIWTEAFARLRLALRRAWKDRDAQHKVYRAQSERYVKYLNKVGLKATAQIKKLLRGASAKGLPESVMRKLDKLEAERVREAAALRELERLVDGFHDTIDCVFGRMTPAQRATVEPRLAAGLGKASHQDTSLRLIRLCSRLRSDAVREALVAATESRAPEARLAACDALARHRRAEAIPALARRLQDDFWQVGRAAIRALEAIGGKPGIDALVAGLLESDGLVQHEMNDALRALTGKNFHGNAALWQGWWTENRDGYDGPPAKKKEKRKRTRRARDPLARFGDPEAADRPDAGGPDDENAGAVSFYGIRTRSKRIIFVLDVSGSMHAPMAGLDLLAALQGKRPDESERKLNHAREQLRLAIVSLPPDAVFNIVTYGDKVKTWKRDTVRASTDNKEAAQRWVEKIEADGQTNIFDALTRALGLIGHRSRGRLASSAADTLYLLTDGHANRGAVVDPGEILDEIERLNQLRRVTIHTIALGTDADAAFMRRLAERFNGRFVHLKGKRGGD